MQATESAYGVPPRLKRLKVRLRPGLAGDLMWGLLIEAGGVKNLAGLADCSPFAIERLTTTSRVPYPPLMQKLAELSGKSLEEVQSVFGPRPAVPSRIQHLIAFKQRQKHLALSADAPKWCLLVREAVDADFSGDYWKAAEACWPEAQSPRQKRSRKNHLWEIARGYSYAKKDAQRVRQPMLHPAGETIDHLCAGLPSLNREQLLVALEAEDGSFLKERRSEIAKDLLNLPLDKIANTRLLHALKERNEKSVQTRSGKGKNPKNKARLTKEWAEIKANPDRHAHEKAKVQPKLARYQHPSDRDRMIRAWRIVEGRHRRKGHTPSPDDRGRFVQEWAGWLGVDSETIERELRAAQDTPQRGRKNQLTLDAYLYVKQISQSDPKPWKDLTRDIHERFGIEMESERHLMQAFLKADKRHGRPVVEKRRLRPFQPRQRWAPEKIAHLQAHYADTSVDELASDLGVSRDQVIQKASRLGIKRPTRPLPTRVAPETRAVFQEYVAHVQGASFARSSRSRLLSNARQLLTFAAGVPVESLTDDHIDRFLAAQRVTPSSARTKRDTLRNFLGFVQGRQPQ